MDLQVKNVDMHVSMAHSICLINLHMKQLNKQLLDGYTNGKLCMGNTNQRILSLPIIVL